MDDQPSSPKRRKLSNSVSENEKAVEEEVNSSLGTQVYDLDNECADILEQNTEPYSYEENGFEVGDCTLIREEAGTPVVEVEEEVDIRSSNTEKPTPYRKVASVFEDAKLIANIVSGVNVQEVYEKLKSRRSNPNRVDIVTNEVLEQMTKQSDQENVNKNNKGNNTVKTSPSLLDDFVSVIDKTMVNLSTLPFSAEEINAMLVRHEDREDRVDLVVSEVLIKHYKRKEFQKEDLVNDMLKVLSHLPGTDPEIAYKLLEEKQRENNRVDKVVEILKNRNSESDQGGSSMRKEDSFSNNPTLRSDPLYRDMRIIAKVLPHKDRNEIYAFLEAHHEKKNRIKIVIEEMLKDSDSQNIPGSLDAGGTATESNGCRMPRNIQDEVDELKEIFPDCDPNYLYDQLEQHESDRERVRNIAMKMFDNRNYPKLKTELTETDKKERAKKKIRNLEFEMQDFLAKFPDPCETFCNEEKQMNESYKAHALPQLLTDFLDMRKGYIKLVLENHNHHYYGALKEIQREIPHLLGYSKRFRETRRALGKETKMPDDPDEFFYHEKLFVEHEQEIKDFLEERKRFKELRLQEAKENGELMECACCYDDECLFDDMSACEDGHLFCKECIRRSSEVVVGQGKTEFPCITGTCEYKFSLGVLQSVLPSNMFSIILKRMQEEEIKMADIPDLVSCPFCSFATIMPNQDDKVFKCLNPECLKESCRLCQEPNHIPLRCNEVEKRGETDMRTYIESRLTEAMLRKCHRCNKYFVKEFGCNKMTCTCGATSCYVCRAKDIDYDHFDGREGRERCTNEGDMNKLHREEMEKAALAAKEQYLKDHPEASEIELKYDPLKHIDDFGGLKEDYGDDEEGSSDEEEEEREEEREEYNSDYYESD